MSKSRLVCDFSGCRHNREMGMGTVTTLDVNATDEAYYRFVVAHDGPFHWEDVPEPKPAKRLCPTCDGTGKVPA